MKRWSPNLFRIEGQTRHVSDDIVERSLAQANRLQEAGFPAILTLNHLAFITGVRYRFLRSIVSRKRDPYRTFTIRKRSGGKRFISVPQDDLLQVQRWIHRHILGHVPDSPQSYAFAKGSTIIACAEQHLGCEWLIKIDLANFFESLSEIQVYRVFRGLGYSPLVAFELARLCTRVLPTEAARYKRPRWTLRSEWKLEESSAPPIETDGTTTVSVPTSTTKQYTIARYSDRRIGHLPQGAPTSPRLANLIVRALDRELAELASSYKLTFTRYADDLTFSTCDRHFGRVRAQEFIRRVFGCLPKYGLRPHPQKVKVVPPGARKVILGLLVDRSRVRLTKDFVTALECHLYYCKKDVVAHAQRRNFASVGACVNHVNGLMSYAQQVDPLRSEKLEQKYGRPTYVFLPPN